MTISHPLTRLQKFRLLSLIPIYFMIVGLFLQPVTEIIPGLITIIKEPDFLITDYFLIGGIGTSFINAGLLTLLCIWTIYFLGMEMDGHTITSSCLMFGFSLFGKNLLNIWAILLGVYLYSHYHKKHMSSYIYIGFYGTSLSPIITQIMYISDLPYAVRLIASLAVGLIIGFVLPPLSTHVHYAHKGYSLYNVGFSSGIIATVIVSVLKSFGITTESRLIWSEGNNQLLFAILCGLFIAMIAAAFLFGGKNVGDSYRKILSCSGIGGTDYLRDNGAQRAVRNNLCSRSRRRVKRTDDRRNLHDHRLLRNRKTYPKHRSDHVRRSPRKFYETLDHQCPVTDPGAFILDHIGTHRRRIRCVCRTSRRIPSLLRRLKCRNCVWWHEFI